MTGHFGTITRTVVPGQGALLVTDYAPGDDGVRVINTGVSGTLLISTSSQLSDASAVPVPAGTSVAWTRSGSLWALAGDDATAPVQMLVTDEISDWQPSPEAVGLAVAEELLENGVPNVLTTGEIGTIPANSTGQFFVFNCAGYDSLIVTAAGVVNGAGTADVSIAFYETQPAVIQSGQQAGPQYPTYPTSGDVVALQTSGDGAIVPITGPWVVVGLLGNPRGPVRVSGSNRAALQPHAVRANSYSSDGVVYTIPGPITANTNYQLSGYITKGQLFAGPCDLSMQVPSGTKGYVGLTIDGTNIGIPVLDSGAGYSGSGGGVNANRLAAFPQNITDLFFRTPAAINSGSVYVMAVPNY